MGKVEPMGRGCQLFWFLNMETIPTVQQQKYTFSHLYISEEIKIIRKKYRQNLNNENLTDKAITDLEQE